MVKMANIEVEPDARRERTQDEPKRNRAAPFIALALVFLPLNAGILLYTAKNAADLRESREVLAGVKRSLDGLKLQHEKQGRNIASGAKADELAIVRQRLENLQKAVAELDDGIRSGLPSSGGSVILSAPGKEVTQRLAPSLSAAAADPEAQDGGLPSVGDEGVSVSNLPRYERSVSPEGKLILRKVR
ncbi:hypothetical protein [Sinorhizobium sp. BJ1]|uniref:hypothetical protein n=1 Tax=Sinorhizobium sp. BJ1 TaxID=2035455 RepID=UPI001FDF84C5|nr:hypothetical protein [Sinorhizobium sp. BJ1]